MAARIRNRASLDGSAGVFMAKAKQAEAEVAEAEGEEAAAKAGFLKSLLSRKLILMAAAGVVVLGGAGGGYVFFFANKHHDEKPAAVSVKPPAFFDMPEVLVNLQSGSGRQSYLKAKIVLEVSDQKIVEEIKPVMPRVMDQFQTYLREVRSSDLEGSAGIYRLRDELTRRVNLAVAPNKVNAVLFKEIIVQ